MLKIAKNGLIFALGGQFRLQSDFFAIPPTGTKNFESPPSKI